MSERDDLIESLRQKLVNNVCWENDDLYVEGALQRELQAVFDELDELRKKTT